MWLKGEHQKKDGSENNKSFQCCPFASAPLVVEWGDSGARAVQAVDIRSFVQMGRATIARHHGTTDRAQLLSLRECEAGENIHRPEGAFVLRACSSSSSIRTLYHWHSPSPPPAMRLFSHTPPTHNRCRSEAEHGAGTHTRKETGTPTTNFQGRRWEGSTQSRIHIYTPGLLYKVHAGCLHALVAMLAVE